MGHSDIPARCVFKQLAASLVCAQSFCILGIAVGSGSVLFHQETSDDSTHSSSFTISQATWLVSSFTLGNVPGNLFSAVLQPQLGAIRLLVCSAPLAIAGAILIGFSKVFALTLAGRVLVGFYFGITEGPARAFTGEVAAAQLRGIISNTLNVVTVLCILVMLALGPLMPWKTTEFSCVLASATLQMLGVLLLPESPKWLTAHGYPRERVEKSLRFFMGDNTDIKQEIKNLESSMETSGSGNGTLTTLKEVFVRVDNLKPTLLLLAQFTCLVFSGGLGVSQFAPTVFEATGIDINPYHSSMYLTGVLAAALLLSGPLLERCGRVRLLQTAAVAGCLGCASMGLYFYVHRHPWLVVVGAAATMLSYGAGIAPVTFSYLVELLPNAIRSVTINLVLLYFSVAQWASIHFFPAMVDAMSNYGVMWLFAAVNFVQLLLASTLLPETRGLSLEDIQKKHFSSRRKLTTSEVTVQTQT